MKLVGDRLYAVRGEHAVFSDVSFEILDGELLLVTGPNGAGKTTLIRIVAGLMSPAAGEVRLEGGRPDATTAEECLYVGHLDGVKSQLTVEENLRFWGRYLGAARAPISAALAEFGLSAVRDVPAAYLSAGQKRRLALTRLRVATRRIWLLDEPTVALDDAAQSALAASLAAHVAAGGMALAASHVPLGIAAEKELRLGAAAQR
jgi:heme exporter protein A